MYQFIHIETYAREASTKTPTKAKASTPQGRLAALGGANAPKGMDAFTQGDGKGTKGKASARDVINEALRNALLQPRRGTAEPDLFGRRPRGHAYPSSRD